MIRAIAEFFAMGALFAVLAGFWLLLEITK
jgi:hypothetical protein